MRDNWEMVERWLRNGLEMVVLLPDKGDQSLVEIVEKIQLGAKIK